MQIVMMKWASASTAIEIERLLNAGKRELRKLLCRNIRLPARPSPRRNR